MHDSFVVRPLSSNTDSPALVAAPFKRNNALGLIPFYLIGGGVIFSDAVLIIIASLLTGIVYHFAFRGWVGPLDLFLGIGALTFVNFSAVLAARSDYRPQNLANFWRQARDTTAVWLFVFLVLSAVAFSFKVSETYSRGATLTFFIFGWSAIVAWRFVVARFIGHALAVGAFAEQKSIALAEEGLREEPGVIDQIMRCGYTVRTFEFARSSISTTGHSSSLLKTINEISTITRHEQIACVFLLMSWDDRRSIEQLMELLRVVSVPVYLLPDRNVAHFLEGRMVNIGTAWTAELKRAPLTAGERAAKRAIDFLLASTTLVMLAPLMILVAALIKIGGRGPVVFVQTRNGFNGRPFKIFKFRTMYVLEDGPIMRQAEKDDPRVTPIGRLLRRTNIDELPQLFNVILGDMSLVGPRPHAATHNSQYEKIISNYAFRHHVKPGLTGWAQVNGWRGETRTVDHMARRVEFDLWYINNWSFWLDFKILLRTLIMGLQPTAY
jgi:Undecaprenyl-phosphate glucose phosphotransferase